MKATAAGRPSIKELEARLGKIVDVRAAARVTALGNILEWYEAAIPFARPNFTREDEARFQRAQKARTIGLQGTTVGESEAALLTTIRLFEKLLIRFGVEVPIQAYYDKLEARREELENREAKFRARYGSMVAGLSAVFGEFKIKFEVNSDATSDRTFDQTKTIYFSKDYAEKLLSMLATDGIFAVIMAEVMPTVAKALALDTDAEGKYFISSTKLSQAISTLAVAMVKFVHANAAQIHSATVPMPAAPTPDAGPLPIQNIWYRGKMADIFEFLLRSSGMTHIDDIRKAVPAAADVTRMLGFIAEKGAETKLWKLTKFRNGFVEFTFTGNPTR